MAFVIPVIRPMRCVPSSRVARQDYTPLFSLLDDAAAEIVRAQRRISHPTPQFVVSEGHALFTLEAELPGFDKKDVEIEFTAEDTLTVRATVGASSATHTAKFGTTEKSAPQDGDQIDGAQIAEKEESAKKPFQASVSDEADEWTEIETPAGTEATSTSATLEDEERKMSDGKGKQPAKSDRQRSHPKQHWTSFSYTYHFSEHVNQEAVEARLDNTVLTIVVPKAAKFEARRVVLD